MNQAIFEEIVRNIDYQAMCDDLPKWGEYVVTCLQAGNLRGEKGWHLYVGYVVQIRKKAGAYGSNLVLLRHADGVLMMHHNQAFCRMTPEQIEMVKGQYPPGMTPEEYEDMAQPYTLGDKFPEVGKIIEPKDDGPAFDESPMMKITVERPDGSKLIEVV